MTRVGPGSPDVTGWGPGSPDVTGWGRGSRAALGAGSRARPEESDGTARVFGRYCGIPAPITDARRLRREVWEGAGNLAGQSQGRLIPSRFVRRISVVGASGVGKSTVARQLASSLGVPFVELDAIDHQPGWAPLAAEEFRLQVAQLAAGDSWVIDGNYSVVRPVVWARADTVVWLDLPRRVVMRQVIGRTLRRVIFRTELWNRNRERWSNLLQPGSGGVHHLLGMAPARGVPGAVRRRDAGTGQRASALRPAGQPRGGPPLPGSRRHGLIRYPAGLLSERR